MENLEPIIKYQVTIEFETDEHFMQKVPAHRQLIDEYINSGVLDHYTVSIESQKSWMVMNAKSKKQAMEYLRKSALFHYWVSITIDEIFVFDGSMYKLPRFLNN